MVTFHDSVQESTSDVAGNISDAAASNASSTSSTSATSDIVPYDTSAMYDTGGATNRVNSMNSAQNPNDSNSNVGVVDVSLVPSASTATTAKNEDHDKAGKEVRHSEIECVEDVETRDSMENGTHGVDGDDGDGDRACSASGGIDGSLDSDDCDDNDDNDDSDDSVNSGEESTSINSGEESSFQSDADGLSFYERLRLRNIQRNEARLAQLGLLIPPPCSGTGRARNGNSNAVTMAPTRNAANETSYGRNKNSNNASIVQERGQSKQKKKMIERRNQPRRKCAKQIDRNGRNNRHDESHDSDESSIPSPVRVYRVLSHVPLSSPLPSDQLHSQNVRNSRNLSLLPPQLPSSRSESIVPGSISFQSPSPSKSPSQSSQKSTQAPSQFRSCLNSSSTYSYSGSRREESRIRSNEHTQLPSSSNKDTTQPITTGDATDAANSTKTANATTANNATNEKHGNMQKSNPCQKRRRSRGRPRRDDYIYVCYEVCFYCGGGWTDFDDAIASEVVGVDVKYVVNSCDVAHSGDTLNAADTVNAEDANMVCDGSVGSVEKYEVKARERVEGRAYKAGDGSKLHRCKDCREVFHLSCMMIHGRIGAGGVTDVAEGRDHGSNAVKADDEECATAAARTNDNAKAEALRDDCATNGSLPAMTTDSKCQSVGSKERNPLHSIDLASSYTNTYCVPKRCFLCDSQRKLTKKHISEISHSPSRRRGPLSAILQDGREVKCAIIGPDSSMCNNEALVKGRNILCTAEQDKENIRASICKGQQPPCKRTFNESKNRQVLSPRYLAYQKEECSKNATKSQHITAFDDTTKKVHKLIKSTLSKSSNGRAQDVACAQLRKYIVSKGAASTIVRLGGIEMLVNAMSSHPERPIIQAEALCTLAEIVWFHPSLGMETVNKGCLNLAIFAMEQHGTHSKVQQMANAFFLALSYEMESCHSMLKVDAITAVAGSMRRNPKKLNVLKEGSSFLQNMIVVSPSAIKSILGARRISQASIPSILLNAIQSNVDDVDFVVSACGCLGMMSLDHRGNRNIASEDGANILHNLLKTSNDLEVLRAAFSSLSNLASSSDEVKHFLAKERCVATSLESMKSYCDPILLTNLFGLLGELSGVDNEFAQEAGSSRVIAVAMKAVRTFSNDIELHLAIFSFMHRLLNAANKHLNLNAAKIALVSMENNCNEETLQKEGCLLLLAMLQTRVERSFLRSGSSKKLLLLAKERFPKSCGKLVKELLHYL